MVRLATAALGPAYDVDISEAHHRFKRDAPSGTALALGEAVAGVRGLRLSEVAVFERHGNRAPRGAAIRSSPTNEVRPETSGAVGSAACKTATGTTSAAPAISSATTR